MIALSYGAVTNAVTHSAFLTFLARRHFLGRNWSRTQHVRRAVPLSLEVLLGFCGFHALFGRWHVVGALYVGFLCLLRTGEILSLKAGQITLSVDSGVALLAMPASKGAKLKNVGESIVVSDPTARALLAFFCRGCSPSRPGVSALPLRTVIRSRHRSSCLWRCLIHSDEAGLLSTSLVLGP